MPTNGKRKRGFQLLLEGLQRAMRGKRRRLEEREAGSYEGGDPLSNDALPAPWLTLVKGPCCDLFIPCLAPAELGRLEAAQRTMRELVLECGGWEACARRELLPGPLVGHLQKQPRLKKLKAMVAACRRGILRPSLEDASFAAALRRANSGLGRRCALRCPLRRTPARPEPSAPGAPSRLHPVDWTSRFRASVTGLCFGQEHVRRSYILLVVAFEDGNAFVLRCHRTPLERAMLSQEDVALNTCTFFRTMLGNLSFLTFHSAICSHRKAITAMFFNKREDRLVTSSLDRRLSVWDVASGRTYSPLLAVFADTAPLLAAVPMPCCEEAFVVASGYGVLRAVNLHGGVSMQRFKLSTPVEALRFDQPGRNLLAGTMLGGLHALVASDAGRLTHRFSYHLGCKGVTCIAFAPAVAGRPARFLIGTAEATVAIADCSYGSGSNAGVLIGLDIGRKVKVSPPWALLACCYSSANGGHLICGSADGSICACPLDGRPVERLRDHGAPISGLAVNAQGTILASADVRGNVVLWRRTVHFPK